MYTPDFLMLLKKIEERFSIYILVKNKLLEMQGMGYRDRLHQLPKINTALGINKNDFTKDGVVNVRGSVNGIQVKTLQKLIMYKGLDVKTKLQTKDIPRKDTYPDFLKQKRISNFYTLGG